MSTTHLTTKSHSKRCHILSIPSHLVVEIAIRVAQDGYRHVGKLMSTCKSFMFLGNDKNVLRHVSFYYLMKHPKHVNIGSHVRSFFLRCHYSRNIDATYLESLRLVTKEGKIEEAILLLSNADYKTKEMYFCLGIFKICSGEYYGGVNELSIFLSLCPSHAFAEMVAEAVFNQIVQIGPVTIRRFCDTWRFKEVPVCAGPGYLCDVDNRCPRCFSWGCSIKFFCMF